MRDAPPLVLASGSPRRTGLLSMLGLSHEVVVPAVPEEHAAGETPDAHVERLAREKAVAGHLLRPRALVLAGDTVVVLDEDLLGKPANEDEALEMLLSLSGRQHTVLSGIALCGPDGAIHSRVERADVLFRDFDAAEAKAYIETGEPMDKAGSYGIQGFGATLVTRVEGDYYTVVGLPIAGLVRLLDQAGWHYGFGRLAARGA